MDKIKYQLEQTINRFSGDFVVPKNAYEKKFCDILGWENFDGRYYDAFDGDTFIEMKKGQNGMHFDMVRYAEIAMGFGQQNTVTIFFKWNRKRKQVEEAFIIDTKAILKFFKIDRTMAKTYLKIYRQVPRSVNILANASQSDLRSMSTFIVKRRKPLMVRLWIPKKEYDETMDPAKWPKINIYIQY